MSTRRTIGAAAASAVALMAMLAGPANAVTPYGAGEWDWVGSDVFTTQSANFYSGGGDFMLCLSSDSKQGQYRLMEEDDFDHDEIVEMYFYFDTDFDSAGCKVFHGINSFVDGDNGKAELYLVKWSGGNSTAYAYD